MSKIKPRPATADQSHREAAPLKSPPAKPKRAEPVLVSASLPIGELPEGEYLSPHLDMQLQPNQARMLRRLSIGLRGMPYELNAEGTGFREDGRLVQSQPDAIRWLLNGMLISAAADPGNPTAATTVVDHGAATPKELAEIDGEESEDSEA